MSTNLNPNVPTLFQNLLWPAAAGNVAWSLISTLTQLISEVSSANTESLWAKAASLLLLSWYMGTHWWREQNGPKAQDRSAKYWVGDGGLLLLIAAFATKYHHDTTESIATDYYLIVLYGFALLFNACGCWDSECHTRFLKAVANAVGISIMLVSILSKCDIGEFRRAVSMSFVMCLLAIARRS